MFTSDDTTHSPATVATGDSKPKLHKPKDGKGDQSQPPPSVSSNLANVYLLKSAKVTIVSAATGQTILESNDEFSSQLTDLDRQLRLNTSTTVPAERYLKFAAGQVREWNDREKVELALLTKEIDEAVADLPLRLPDRIYVVRSTLQEEFGANYTRGQTLVLGSEFFDDSKHDHAERRLILAHEIFHLASRYDSSLRKRSHEAVGCVYKTGQLILDAKIRGSLVTNPDAYEYACALRVTVTGNHADLSDNQLWVMPAPVLDRSQAAQLKYSDLKIKLIVVDAENGHWQVQYDASGQPKLIDAAATNFVQLLAINSDYVMHAEEIIADNFALLLEQIAKNTPSKTKKVKINRPEFLNQLKIILLKSS